ncbi:MAG: hypothetical protein FJ029_03015 [Actinobacteria bacterium]|nr:hypothetical protein [Actinomycetota bacterium]
MRRSFPQPRGRRSAGVNVVYDLLRCIETGDPPLCSGEDAREALEIAIATRESHRRGRVRVDLPLPDRQLQIVSYEDMRFNIPRGILRKRGVAGA